MEHRVVISWAYNTTYSNFYGIEFPGPFFFFFLIKTKPRNNIKTPTEQLCFYLRVLQFLAVKGGGGTG